MIPTDWPISVYRGDSHEEIFRIRDADPNVVFELTGYTGKAQIRRIDDNGDGVAVAVFTVTLMNQADVPGGFTLYLPPTESAKLEPGDYKWDVQFSDATSTNVNTYLAGKVTVIGDVTI